MTRVSEAAVGEESNFTWDTHRDGADGRKVEAGGHSKDTQKRKKGKMEVESISEFL